MEAHDAVSDDGERVVCGCGREWEGRDARDKHIGHQRVETAREALRKATEERVGAALREEENDGS